MGRARGALAPDVPGLPPRREADGPAAAAGTTRAVRTVPAATAASGADASHHAQERRRRRDDYRAAVLAYREAVASGADFEHIRECVQVVETSRRLVKLPEDRRRVERELT